MNPIMILGLVMAVYSIIQYRKYRQRSRLMFLGFWGFLAVETATGLPLLLIPVVAFLGLGIYYRFIVKDKWMKEAKIFLTEQGVTDEEIRQTGKDIKEEGKKKKLENLRQEEKREEEEAARAEFATTKAQGFTDIIFRNSKEVSYFTGRGEKLTIGAGEIKASIQMDFRPERTEKDEVDTILFDIRLADATETVWESNSFLEPYLMTDPLEADTKNPPSGLVLWKDASSLWKQAIKQKCLIAGVLNLLDSRDANELNIGETSYNVYFKYQGPRIDVAYLDTSSSFIIRISDLYHDIYQGDEFIDREEMPPFCFEMPSEQFLFISSAEHYYSYYEEWYDIDEGKGKKPLLFGKSQEQGMPQSQVHIADE